MIEFIEFIAKYLVDKPENVKMEETEENGVYKYLLTVDDNDIGKIIGKKGKTIMALRTLVTAVAAKDKRRALLEVKEKVDKK